MGLLMPPVPGLLRLRRLRLPRCCCRHLDGSLVDAFEEDVGWYWSSGRPNVCELVSFCIVGPGDVVELTAVETSFECVVKLLIGRHVVGYCVAISHRLLDDEIGVPVDYEGSVSACFGYAHATKECLVLCFV